MIEKNDELVQYYVVNKELNMSPLKIAGQVAHAATILAVKYGQDESFKTWFAGSQTKIMLQGKEKDLERCIQLGFDEVHDEGRTEIPENSLTVVALKPIKRGEVDKFVKRLRLYR